MTRRRVDIQPDTQKGFKAFSKLLKDLRDHCDGVSRFDWAIINTGIYLMLHKMDANAREAAIKEMKAYVKEKAVTGPLSGL